MDSRDSGNRESTEDGAFDTFNLDNSRYCASNTFDPHGAGISSSELIATIALGDYTTIVHQPKRRATGASLSSFVLSSSVR